MVVILYCLGLLSKDRLDERAQVLNILLDVSPLL
jgi:hypothetical protein